MLQSLSVATLAAILLLATPTPQGPPATKDALQAEVQLSRPAVGEFHIDTTAGHAQLTLPATPRVFASNDAFIRFCIQQFNGKAIYDKTGKVIGAFGHTTVTGTAVAYDASSKSVVAVHDPILAMIGGLHPSVIIAGKTIRLQPRLLQHAARIRSPYMVAVSNPPSETKPCGGNGCTDDTSFDNNYVFYKSDGSETDQTSGGYQSSSYVCWQGWHPAICTKHSGSNLLTISDRYFNYAAPIYSSQSQARNVSSLQDKVWAVGTDFGAIVGNITGTCGYHDAGVQTGDGKHGPC